MRYMVATSLQQSFYVEADSKEEAQNKAIHHMAENRPMSDLPDIDLLETEELIVNCCPDPEPIRKWNVTVSVEFDIDGIEARTDAEARCMAMDDVKGDIMMAGWDLTLMRHITHPAELQSE